MSEPRPAPANQPTSNIELQLKHAKAEYYKWECDFQRLTKSVETAQEMMDKWDEREVELEYQLRIRRSEGK